MYGISYIYLRPTFGWILKVNVCKYAMHGSYGHVLFFHKITQLHWFSPGTAFETWDSGILSDCGPPAIVFAFCEWHICLTPVHLKNLQVQTKNKGFPIRFAKCSCVEPKNTCVSKCLITVVVKGWCIISEEFISSLQNEVKATTRSDYLWIPPISMWAKGERQSSEIIGSVNHHGKMSWWFVIFQPASSFVMFQPPSSWNMVIWWGYVPQPPYLLKWNRVYRVRWSWFTNREHWPGKGLL